MGGVTGVDLRGIMAWHVAFSEMTFFSFLRVRVVGFVWTENSPGAAKVKQQFIHRSSKWSFGKKGVLSINR